jgi:hypothetical protein
MMSVMTAGSEQSAVGVMVWRGLGSERPVRERTLRTRLHGLGLPTRFTVNELAEALARQRGKPIILRAASFPAGVLTGGLLITDSVDFIAYPRTTPLHRDHIIGHELGHIICRHSGMLGSGDDSALRAVFPNLSPAIVRDMLRRDRYTDIQEQEAEMMASVIFQQMNRRPLETTAEATPAGETCSVIARMERSLRHSPGEPA